MNVRYLVDSIPSHFRIGNLLEQFDDRPIVFVGEQRNTGLKELVCGAGSKHGNTVFTRHIHADAQVLVHRANVAASVLELAIHDQLGTILE